MSSNLTFVSQHALCCKKGFTQRPPCQIIDLYVFSSLQVLTDDGFGPITTEIVEAKPFYYAEDYHQQYLSKNPDGYCGLRGTGVACPIGIKK